MKRVLLRIGLVILAVCAVLALLLWLNPLLRERLRGQARYQLPLPQIECDPPPGLTRAQFLDEVQYYASVTDQLDVLRDDLEDHVSQMFARHPWVKHVDRVDVKGPQDLRVELTFRRPVLAVRTGKELRVVDAEGVLLPRNASTMGLPVLEKTTSAPRGPEGAPWGDPIVEKAARAQASK